MELTEKESLLIQLLGAYDYSHQVAVFVSVFSELARKFPDMTSLETLKMTFKQTGRYELEAEFEKMWARLANTLL